MNNILQIYHIKQFYAINFIWQIAESFHKSNTMVFGQQQQKRKKKPHKKQNDNILAYNWAGPCNAAIKATLSAIELLSCVRRVSSCVSVCIVMVHKMIWAKTTTKKKREKNSSISMCMRSFFARARAAEYIFNNIMFVVFLNNFGYCWDIELSAVAAISVPIIFVSRIILDFVSFFCLCSIGSNMNIN